MPTPKFLIAGRLIVGAICYLMFSGINDSMIYYYSVSELMQKESELSGEGIRVSGYVSPGTIRLDQQLSQVEFVVSEKNSEGSLPVVYQGLIPDTFKDHAEVVVEGSYHSGQKRFHATTLLAKCPSKYESKGEEHSEEIPVAQRVN